MARGSNQMRNALWLMLVTVTAMVLLYLFGVYFYKGMREQLRFNEDVAVFLTIVAIVVLVCAIVMCGTKRKPKGNARRSTWYKHLGAFGSVPKAWVPPSIWRKESAEEESREEKAALRSDFARLDRLEFERFVMRLLGRMGYDAEAAPKRDSKLLGFPVSIIARKGGRAAVVKTNAAGEGILEEKDVAALLRSRKRFRAKDAIIVSASAVSNDARAAAKAGSIGLWDDRTLRRMVKEYM